MGQDVRFDETVGPKGGTVRVMEETRGGTVVLVAAEDPDVSGYSYRENLGFAVRDAEGQVVPALRQKALQIATERSSQRLAGRKLDDVQAEEDANDEGDDRTVAEVFDLFRTEELPHDRSEGRQEELERSMTCWENWLGPNFPLVDFGRSEWTRFIRERKSGRIDYEGHRVRDPENQRPVSDATVRRDLGDLRQVCGWAAD